MNIGQVAPHFSLFDTNRSLVNLSDKIGQKIILFFFPAAWTSVCSKEMCSVGDDLSFYQKLGAEVIGISVDSPFAPILPNQQLFALINVCRALNGRG